MADHNNEQSPAKTPISTCFRLLGGSFPLFLLVVVLTLFLTSFGIGRSSIPIENVILILASKFLPISQSWPSVQNTIILQIRFPRIVAATLVGASLAIAGASFQGLFRNPLVSPDILGVSQGASMGAAVAILFFSNNAITQIFAFCFAMIAVGLTYLVNTSVKGNPVLSLILSGVAVSSLFGAILSLIKYIADPNNKLPAITYWLLGSFASSDNTSLTLASIPMITGIVILLLLRWRLNVLAMGEEEAKALGMNTTRMRAIVVICCTVITAAGVCISGIIGWVGLVMPHVGRMLVGPNHKILIPVTALLGAAYLLLIDDIVRTASSIEIPIGIMTAIIGAPFFIHLLRKGQWGWG